MGSIQKRSNGAWRARYRDPSGKEHARHFRRKLDAEAWLGQVQASIVRGDYLDPRAGVETFRAFFDDWTSRQVWAAGTLEAAQRAVEGLPFADMRLRDIRRSHVEAWIKHMSTTLAPTTVKMRHNYVAMGFKAAVRDKLIRESPCDGVKLPKVPKAEARMMIPSVGQVAAAVEQAPDPTFRGFIGVCAYAGLRLGEAAGLQVGDVDFLRREVRVRRQVQGNTRDTSKVVPPKAGSARTVPVDDRLLELLSVQAGYAWGEDGWLFGLGDLLNRGSAGHQWRQTRALVGMEAFTLHDLRHYYASGLIAAGCDVVTVQTVLGHSSPAITLDVYSHLWPQADDKVRAAAATLWAPADPVRTQAVDSAADLRVQQSTNYR